MISDDEWPANWLDHKSFCPLCGSAKRILLHAGLDDRVYGVAPGKWTLYRCTNCESAWLDPRPSRAAIGLAYVGYYTHEASDHPIVRRKGSLRTFIHDALNDYRNNRYGLNRTPSNPVGRWLIPLIPPLQAAVDAECRHLSRPPVNGGRLLDIGSGSGSFLKIATEMGWSAEGVDFDQEAVAGARSRGLNVRCVGAEGLQNEIGGYDVITLSHVIEHVHDPIGLLEEVYRLLKPGGVMWLETPNICSLGARKFGAAWRGLEIPRHLTITSMKSMKQVLSKVGFINLRVRWRGLVVFNIYAESEAIASCKAVKAASRNGKPPFAEMVSELHEMLISEKREFITLTAIKPISP